MHGDGLAMITAVAVRFTILTAILGGKDSDSLQVSGQQNLLCPGDWSYSSCETQSDPSETQLLGWGCICVPANGRTFGDIWGAPCSSQVGYFLSLAMMIPFICAVADLKSAVAGYATIPSGFD